jgi:acyl-coenzyme A thioesterase PaaI-like protein
MVYERGNIEKKFIEQLTNREQGVKMRYHVKAKQENSKMCLVCGLKNPFGLRSSFYELDNDELLAVFRPMEEHQSYPGRLHGGIATAILDETIGRAIMIRYQDIWGVTIEFATRYRKPVPLSDEIRVIGRIKKDTNRYFEGTGEILLKDGSVAIEGRGKFLKLPLDKIAEFDFDVQEWKIVPSQDDPEFVEI